MSLSTFFFFNDTATTEIYTLSLHDALPISPRTAGPRISPAARVRRGERRTQHAERGASAERELLRAMLLNRARVEQIAEKLGDRKSTRLNSSHDQISYAVFCLKKKTN